jgi:hypothetical protein
MIKKLQILLIFLLSLQLFGCSQNNIVPPAPTLYIKMSFVNASALLANRFHVVIAGLNSSSQSGFYDLSKDPAVFVITNNLSDVPVTT